jgi:hypothetical protein
MGMIGRIAAILLKFGGRGNTKKGPCTPQVEDADDNVG